MNKFMHQNWWKVLSVLLLLYAMTVGMLVPLKPNLVSVTPDNAELGQAVSLNMLGYNTTFTDGELQAWLRAGDGLALKASSVKVSNDREATATFNLPAGMPVADRERVSLSLIVSNAEDGTFVRPDALSIRQREGSAATVDAAAWSRDALQKGDLAASTKMTFPYRGLLSETIRNTYFHVSLWFAMMFVFIAGVTYAVKRLRAKTFEVRERADLMSLCFTGVGMLFGILGLLTGAVWAKYTWGSFWSWDIKQFTTLIALMIYGGYFVLRASFPDPEQRGRLGAVYNIFAFACLIPLIYILPRLSGNSLHPGAAGNPAMGGEDLDNTMRMVFYPTIIGWTLFGFWMATVGYRIRALRERFDEAPL